MFDLNEKIVYMDNAATTMHKPQMMIESMMKAFGSLGNAGRGAHNASLDASRVIYDTREKLAQLFHVKDAKQIVFTSNATMSLNMAIKGILSKGDHVITTQLEHNSVLRPLYEMQDERVEVSFIESDTNGVLHYEQFEKAIQDNTKAIICTHASNVTGNVVNLHYIGELCKKHHLLFIVDASQSAGFLDIDVEKNNIDVLCFTGHKSLYGPQGIGGMYVRKGIDVKPLFSGGSGVQSYLKHHPKEYPTALEAGTLNGHGIAGLHGALTYIETMGRDIIMKQTLEIMWYFYNEVKKINGVKIYGDFREELRCPIVSINIREYPSSEVSDVLYDKYHIATRSNAHCAPLMHTALHTIEQGVVRFSFSHFNTKEEVDYAVEAIKEIARIE